MEGWDVPYRHSVQTALAVLRGRWTVAVLAALAGGETQYKDLLASVNTVELRVNPDERPLSDRVLTDTLRRARVDGLIERHAEPGNFGSVKYTLTPIGRSLLRAVRPLAEWGQLYREEVRPDQLE